MKGNLGFCFSPDESLMVGTSHFPLIWYERPIKLTYFCSICQNKISYLKSNWWKQGNIKWVFFKIEFWTIFSANVFGQSFYFARYLCWYYNRDFSQLYIILENFKKIYWVSEHRYGPYLTRKTGHKVNVGLSYDVRTFKLFCIMTPYFFLIFDNYIFQKKSPVQHG